MSDYIFGGLWIFSGGVGRPACHDDEDDNKDLLYNSVTGGGGAVGWGVLSGAVPSRIMPERQLCHDICSFRRSSNSSNRREESSFFSEFFFDLCEHQGRVLLLKLSP